jgi:hypothetical protein
LDKIDDGYNYISKFFFNLSLYIRYYRKFHKNDKARENELKNFLATLNLEQSNPMNSLHKIINKSFNINIEYINLDDYEKYIFFVYI